MNCTSDTDEFRRPIEKWELPKAMRWGFRMGIRRPKADMS